MSGDLQARQMAELLAYLQGKLDQLLSVEISVDPMRLFFGVRFTATLVRVETVNDQGSVVLHFSNGALVDIGSREQTVIYLDGLVRFEVGGSVALELLSPDAGHAAEPNLP
jgi:hypothetical protein